MTKFVVGIDEVGRGPLAGPLMVCAVMVAQTTKSEYQISKLLEGIKDSKKLSEKKRDEWFIKLSEARDKGLLNWRISYVSAGTIDEIGISSALRTCVARCLKDLKKSPEDMRVLLDGGLHAPSVFLNQETIIHGEDKEVLIAAASIVAKVTRDKRMKNYALSYPEYGFEKHKGYGTKYHYAAIRSYGLCDLHRQSFLKNFLKNKHS